MGNDHSAQITDAPNSGGHFPAPQPLAPLAADPSGKTGNFRRLFQRIGGFWKPFLHPTAGPRLVSAGTDPESTRHTQGVNGLFAVMERARAGAERSAQLFPLVTAIAFSAGSVLSAGILITLGHFLLNCPHLLLALGAIVPSALIAGAIAHLVGNALIRRLSGLSNMERRSLALHLPWNRTPAEWSNYYRRWIYCGDWLVDNFSGDLLPYVRAFVTGEVPQSIEEELALWNGFMQRSRNSCEMEVGHSVRELACVDALPNWTRDITPGMNLPELEKMLGKAGRDWALSLLKRAATRKRIFSLVNTNGDLKEVLFEFHYSRLEDGREGLMVILRPHLPRHVKFVDDSFSDVA